MHRIMILTVFGLTVAVGAAEKPLPSPIVYNRDIRPILADNCWHCHGPDDRHREAKLRLDVRSGALTPLEGGRLAIVPGKPDLSELVRRITHADPNERMPLKSSNKILTARQIAMLKQWISEGAEYEEHWSFAALKKAAVPKVSDPKWARQPIDAFIAARLDREGLKLQREADRPTLIRRVAFDLTGLPPKPDEVAAFVNDQSGDAYEKMVDRYLASPHYGERMALDWLDAARYGDSSVFHADGPRDMWAWRDGVIRAFNRNQPYNEFSIEQLAGDLIPDATPEQRVASGFNRNNGTTDEGGAIAEEYRVEYAVDRVKTTSMIWLGLTMECAQCHEHKYDPISQTDYYKYYAFFNISDDKGMQTRNGNAEPMLKLPDPEKEAQLPGVRKEISDVDQQMQARAKASEPEYVAWLKKVESDPMRQTGIPADALAYYPLNEGKGKNVACSVDDKRKGQFKGKVGWTDAKLSKGLKFDGKSYVDLGDVGNFERTDAFSYGCWVYPESNSAGAAIARMDDGGGHRGYDLYLSGGSFSAHIIHEWPENAIKVTSKKKLKLKQWQHVFVTYDGSSEAKGVTLYVDGEKWDWNPEQDDLSKSIRTDKSLYLGSRHPGSRYNGQLDEVRLYARALSEAEVKTLAGEDVLGPILAKKEAERSDADRKVLRNHYLHQEDGAYKKLLAQHAKLKARETDLLKPLTTVMVMKDMDKPRDTFVLMRGAYDHPSEQKVQPSTPAVLPPMPEGAPANRLGLAQWLFQDDHPLTARVTVNRYWNLVFGHGLVATLEDFGSQGQYPSHPELLDWLAVDFRENGWDVKRLMRQMLTSAAYRQVSVVTAALYEQDPENTLLARGPRFRLQGEFIRDQALAVSGLLVPTIGGPGVKPYQPPGLWNEVSLSGNVRFVQDKGEKLYRRSLYTYWKRSAPPPSMRIFDAPTREKCIVRRPRTNTPLQALVTLNDVQYVEAARFLAQRAIKEAEATPESRIGHLYRLVLGRQPKPAEQHILLGIYRDHLSRFKADADAAAKLLAFGDSKRDESIDATEHASWTLIASMILNLDEALTKG